MPQPMHSVGVPVQNSQLASQAVQAVAVPWVAGEVSAFLPLVRSHTVHVLSPSKKYPAAQPLQLLDDPTQKVQPGSHFVSQVLPVTRLEMSSGLVKPGVSQALHFLVAQSRYWCDSGQDKHSSATPVQVRQVAAQNDAWHVVESDCSATSSALPPPSIQLEQSLFAKSR